VAERGGDVPGLFAGDGHLALGDVGWLDVEVLRFYQKTPIEHP